MVTSQLHEEELEERFNRGDHQTGALMENVVLCSAMVKKAKGWRWGKLTSRVSKLDSKEHNLQTD